MTLPVPSAERSDILVAEDDPIVAKLLNHTLSRRRIGVVYTIGVHEQGSLYTRRGATAGIAGRF